MTNKYEFTGETKIHFGVTLRQIRAIRAFGFIAIGTIGGWIESEKNLSQVYGDAWVYGDARVYGDAQVSGGIICATRSDGYTFLAAPTIKKDGLIRIIAGCRYFTFAEGRAHWNATRGGTPLGEESLAILDHLERMAKVVFPNCPTE